MNKDQEYAHDFFHTLKKDFKKKIFKVEISDENKAFADIFAQTIIYGAFSSWVKFSRTDSQEKGIFCLNNVDSYLPFGSFLRELFLILKNESLPELQPLFTELEEVLLKANYDFIFTHSESLITTFYSDFLKLYDPETAKDMGVEYTPFEIVEYMVEGIDFVLKRWLDCRNGIITGWNHGRHEVIEMPKGSQNIRILDPAAGTMAFASGLLHVAQQKCLKMQLDGAKPSLPPDAFENWVSTQFFRNFQAFEVLMAPYVLGRLRIFLKLEEMGLTLNSGEHHFKSYLMNALINPPEQSRLDMWINQNSKKSIKAVHMDEIQKQRDILIIMGNPPYNLSSQNVCEWINHKIMDYKRGLEEKNKKILSDDYVKFLRFGQWKIEQAGCGVLAFITNNKYLDGQMFSVMRKSLRKTFDHIYIVNLHGDMRKKESGNPFDIRVGVAIALMVRVDNSSNKNAAIHYLDAPQNTREEKFEILAQGFHENRFKLLSETSKNYFIDFDTANLEEFESFTPINEFFYQKPTSGIMVGRDHLLMDVDRENVLTNLSLFFNRQFGKLESLKIKIHDTKSWSKEKVFHNTNFEEVSNAICKIRYRGFDFRYLAYQRNIVEGHRMGYIDQISENNPAITVTKASRRKIFENAFISPEPVEKCYMSVVDTAYAFPLQFDNRSNLNVDMVPFHTSPEELFFYLYGILHTPQYRHDFNEYLLKYYPRIPFPPNSIIYKEISALGEQIANLHLLRNPISKQLSVIKSSSDDWFVKDFYYSPGTQTLYFDGKKKKSTSADISCIQGLKQEVWDFTIGNVPQIAQFLKSRRYSATRKWNTLQRALDLDELTYLLKMISAIDAGLAILPKLDKQYLLLSKKD